MSSKNYSENNTALIQKQFRIFAVSLLVFSLLVTGFTFLYALLAPAHWFSKGIPFIILLMLIINFLVHHFLMKALRKKPASFVITFMAASIIKLFIYLPVIAVYVYNFRKEALPFTLAFFILYMLYTGIELFFVTKALRIVKSNTP